MWHGVWFSAIWCYVGDSVAVLMVWCEMLSLGVMRCDDSW